MLLTSGNLIAQQRTRTSNSHLCQHSVFISNVLFSVCFSWFTAVHRAFFPLTFFCYNLENKSKTLFFHQISPWGPIDPNRHSVKILEWMMDEWMDRLIAQDTLNTKMNKISWLVKRQACIWITNPKLSWIYARLSCNFRFTHVPIPFVLCQESFRLPLLFRYVFSFPWGWLFDDWLLFE